MEFEIEKIYNSAEIKRRIIGCFFIYPILVTCYYIFALAVHTSPHTFSGRRLNFIKEIILLVPPWFWAGLLAAIMIIDIGRLIIIYKRRRREEIAQEENSLGEE
jgi:hypothetical protein